MAQLIIEAIAEHGEGAIGGMLPIRKLTRITLGKTYREGGKFVSTEAGHLPDGALVVIADHGKTYRLNLVAPAAQAQRVAA